MRSPVLSTWYTLSHSFFLPTWNWYYNYPDFKGEETEEAKEQVQIPESASCRAGAEFCFIFFFLFHAPSAGGPGTSLWCSSSIPSKAFSFCLTLKAFHSLGPASALQSLVLSPSVPPDCSLPLYHHPEAHLPLPKTPAASRIWPEKCCLYHIVQDLISFFLWQHFRDLTSPTEDSALQALDQKFFLLWLLALSCAYGECWRNLQACLQPRLHSLWHRWGEKA